MSGTGTGGSTGPVESGSPASNLGTLQWLRLPSGALYEHIGGLRYRASEGNELYAGEGSYIRIFRPAGSEPVHATLFLPHRGSSPLSGAQAQLLESGLIERLGVVEANEPNRFHVAANGPTRNCAVLRSTEDSSEHFRLDHYEREALEGLVMCYAEKLTPRYEQEGEARGGKIGGAVLGVLAGLAGAYAVLPELKGESVLAAGVVAASAWLLGREVGKSVGAYAGKNGAYWTLQERLLRGHENETNLYHVAKFIREDLPSIMNSHSQDSLSTMLDGAFRGLTRAVSQRGTFIRWHGLSYDDLMVRCEMLLGISAAWYLPVREAPATVPAVSDVPAVVVNPAIVAQVSTKLSAPATRCPHCHDSFKAGESCVTGLMRGAAVQTHAECSDEMAGSADWKPVSGAYAYESLVDNTSGASKKKDERRVKE